MNVELVPTMSNGWPDEERLLECVQRPDTRALAVSLVQFSNGYRADVARLGSVCRAEDCFFVVDGIQGIGQVAFDVTQTPVDILACGAQKWLLSPWGSGFVYVNKDLLNDLAPPVVGWMAFEGMEDVAHLTDYTGALRADARRFEVNTLPFQDLIAMGHSVRLLLELGIQTIQDWLREVRAPLLDGAAASSYEIKSPTDGAHESAIVCVATANTEETWRKLIEHQVTCALREGVIRISPHCFNAPEEMERVVSILAKT